MPDWCVSCKGNGKVYFFKTEVRAALAGFVLLQADVTNNDDDDQALMRRYHIVGPPDTLFYGADGARETGVATGRIRGHARNSSSASPPRRSSYPSTFRRSDAFRDVGAAFMSQSSFRPMPESSVSSLQPPRLCVDDEGLTRASKVLDSGFARPMTSHMTS